MSTKVTEAEVNDMMKLSEVILTIAFTKEPHVGLGAIAMAMGIACSVMRIPLEDATSLMERNIEQIYATAQNGKED